MPSLADGRLYIHTCINTLLLNYYKKYESVHFLSLWLYAQRISINYGAAVTVPTSGNTFTVLALFLSAVYA